MTLQPAPANHGVVFRRTDVSDQPEIAAAPENVTELVRSTDLGNEWIKVHTIEHLLSALHGLGVDNAIVEIDGPEMPIVDGSGRAYTEMVREAGPVAQEADRRYIQVREPLSFIEGDRSLIALPYDGLRITCTSADNRGIHTQHLTIDIDPETYAREIAPARTFTVYEDIEPLLKAGKIRGGSLDSAIVIKGDKILSKEPLRYSDELVRHKILDIIGDLYLLGAPLRGHIIANLPGHALNHGLVRVLAQANGHAPRQELQPPTVKAKPRRTTPVKMPTPPRVELPEGAEAGVDLDIRGVLDHLPHRFPMILIDRVLYVDDQKCIAIKNVSVNEPYFTGHFPAEPIMPGVLQVEAMAQAAGILLMRHINAQGKISLLVACNNVKFRKKVQPGDQLLITVDLVRVRSGRVGSAKARCEVEGQTVSAGEFLFTIVDEEEAAD